MYPGAIMKTVSTFGGRAVTTPPARRRRGRVPPRGARHRGRPVARVGRAGGIASCCSSASRCVACTNSSTPWRCRSHWSASTSASSRRRAWWPVNAPAARCTTGWSTITSRNRVGRGRARGRVHGTRTPLSGTAVAHPAAGGDLGVLENVEEFRSAQELHDELRRAGEHRTDHRVPHSAIDGERRPRRHPAHGHR